MHPMKRTMPPAKVNQRNGMWKRGKAPILPVTVLTGFLGSGRNTEIGKDAVARFNLMCSPTPPCYRNHSGKTTLMNHILNDDSHKMKFAIIENEFGDVGIDENILSENVDEEVIEVMNGCICCTVRGDLVVALKKLYKKVESFNGVIIETTGLADPAPVIQTFFVDEEIMKLYKLDSVITVTDAKYIMERLNEEKPEGVENESVEQVAFADKIILNKTDLAKDEAELEAIEERLRSLNPQAPILRCQYSKISPKELLNIQAFDLKRVLDFEPDFLDDSSQEHQHDTSVVSTSTKMEGEVNIEMLSRWIERLISEDGANLYRYKGVMAVKGKEEKFVFQGVGMLFSGAFEGRWKPHEKRESRFVFIGKNLDMEFLKCGFEACRVSNQLRFAIGDPVVANCGIWKKGKVVAHWDDGNAYRIRLDDVRDTEVWAPVDVEAYVRARAA
jgi:G3E family GTPase